LAHLVGDFPPAEPALRAGKIGNPWAFTGCGHFEVLGMNFKSILAIFGINKNTPPMRGSMIHVEIV
jgi:hypothetical protein